MNFLQAPNEDYAINFAFPNYSLEHIQSLLLFILFRKRARREGCNVMKWQMS